MTQIQATRKPRKVRASVIRRTIVGSLVVMLSSFLTILDNNADPAVKTRMPITLDSTPVAERQLPEEVLPLLQAPISLNQPSTNGNALSSISIETSLLKEANSYWIYENVVPEAATRG